jgi:subtilisin family serine protease
MSTTRNHRFTSRRSLRVLATMLVALTIVSLTASTSGAAQPGSRAAREPEITTPGSSWDALRSAANQDGTVGVIVGLRVDDTTPDSELVDKTADTPRGKPDREPQIRGVRAGLERRFGGRMPQGYRSGEGAPFVTMRVTPAELDTLRSAGDEVASISLDETRETAGTSSYGADNGQQLDAQWDYSRIGADWANNNGYTGKGTKIAVIDTGVDRNNPYLSGQILNEACFATNADGSGACPGGKTARYSTTNRDGVIGAANPCAGNYWSTSCSHGTHVAHTAAGAYGVARGAKVIAINASHLEYGCLEYFWSVCARWGWAPRFNDSDVLWSLWYVDTVLPKLGIVAAAVNLSIGGGRYTGYCDSTGTGSYAYWINRLRSNYQIPVVVSSGNDNWSDSVSSPACNSTAISVGNTTLDSGRDAVFSVSWGGSNSNSTLDLLAPGTDICSAVPKSLDDDGNANGWQCGWIGTSMAAPQVSGAIAILTQKRPTATMAAYQGALTRSGSSGGTAVQDSRNGVVRTRINVAWAVYLF